MKFESFDITEALADPDRVVLGDGRKILDLKFFPIAIFAKGASDGVIAAQVGTEVHLYYSNGVCTSSFEEETRLYLKPKPHRHFPSTVPEIPPGYRPLYAKEAYDPVPIGALVADESDGLWVASITRSYNEEYFFIVPDYESGLWR